MGKLHAMPHNLLLVASALFVSTSLAAPVATSALEALLYTPTQRIQINRNRMREAPTPPAPVAEVKKLTGVLQRANDNGTVWINGEPLFEGATNAPRIRGRDAIVHGKRLQVGEAVNTGTGERSDVVAPGAVTLQRKP